MFLAILVDIDEQRCNMYLQLLIIGKSDCKESIKKASWISSYTPWNKEIDWFTFMMSYLSNYEITPRFWNKYQINLVSVWLFF